MNGAGAHPLKLYITGLEHANFISQYNYVMRIVYGGGFKIVSTVILDNLNN